METPNTTAKNVTVVFHVTQMGKNPFSIQHTTTARAKDATLKGLATKTAYAIADSLLTLAANAMQAKERYGSYITAFRPKSVFKIEVSVDGKVCFYALSVKGIDAIRLVDGKGAVLSRNLIVDKMLLIAESVESANSFAQSVDFQAQIERDAREAATEAKRLEREVAKAAKLTAKEESVTV